MKSILIWLLKNFGWSNICCKMVVGNNNSAWKFFNYLLISCHINILKLSLQYIKWLWWRELVPSRNIDDTRETISTPLWRYWTRGRYYIYLWLGLLWSKSNMAKTEASLKSIFLKELRTWAECTSIVGPKAIYYTHMLPIMQALWAVTFVAAG